MSNLTPLSLKVMYPFPHHFSTGWLLLLSGLFPPLPAPLPMASPSHSWGPPPPLPSCHIPPAGVLPHLSVAQHPLLHPPTIYLLAGDGSREGGWQEETSLPSLDCCPRGASLSPFSPCLAPPLPPALCPFLALSLCCLSPPIPVNPWFSDLGSVPPFHSLTSAASKRNGR